MSDKAPLCLLGPLWSVHSVRTLMKTQGEPKKTVKKATSVHNSLFTKIFTTVKKSECAVGGNDSE